MQRCLVLKDELRVDRQHCCPTMTREVRRCEEHPNVFDCPDSFVYYSGTFDEYGIVNHLEQQVGLIAFCPWCGAALPPSRRDEWLQALDARGIDPWRYPIPEEFRSERWREG